jgi:hypothetical protein
MRRIVNPKQTCLFDPFDPVLTDQTRKRLLNGWPGIFRHVILELMPVEAIAGHFHPVMGRPTKELYSMAGLMLIMEFMDWTKDQALDAYCFHMNVHYALNLEPVAQELSIRTLERYIALFEEDDLAKKVLHEVTTRLVDLLALRIDQQRLDSTHVFSDMAQFGRTRLMGVAIKRFLSQVKRHAPQDYQVLDETLRRRYAPSEHQLFADTAKGTEARRHLRQQVAEDLYGLIRHFSDRPEHTQRSTYKTMERIFSEQCRVEEEMVTVKDKTGGSVMQNPSDPDATYDGHKGPGYQVQIAETCHPDNEVQLITCAIPQTAAEPDPKAVAPVLEDLKASNLLPEQMLVDSAYSSDANVCQAEQQGVELVGPVPAGTDPSKDIHSLSIDDFVVDEGGEVVQCCPAGHVPQSSVHDVSTGKTRTVMPATACGRCEYLHECPVRQGREGFYLEHTASQRRLAGRRREEATEAFRQRYRLRAGIEGTNSGLKRRLGMDRVRVRGAPGVFRVLYLKITGWNILRASVYARMREIVYARALAAVLTRYLFAMKAQWLSGTVRGVPDMDFRALFGVFGRGRSLSIAA